MEDFKLEIIRARNGYIVKGLVDGEDIEFTEVIEESIEVGKELEVMQNLLYFVKDYFGVFYSKHNEKNLVIEIEKTKE